jgi:hypothetical protein
MIMSSEYCTTPHTRRVGDCDVRFRAVEVRSVNTEELASLDAGYLPDSPLGPFSKIATSLSSW